VAVVFLADLGDDKAPGGALHETCVQPLLQQGDAAAEARFRHPEGAGRRRKATVIHGLDEEIEVIEISHRSDNRTLRPDMPV
jgi:hypothetical protein